MNVMNWCALATAATMSRGPVSHPTCSQTGEGEQLFEGPAGELRVRAHWLSGRGSTLCCAVLPAKRTITGRGPIWRAPHPHPHQPPHPPTAPVLHTHYIHTHTHHLPASYLPGGEGKGLAGRADAQAAVMHAWQAAQSDVLGACGGPKERARCFQVSPTQAAKGPRAWEGPGACPGFAASPHEAGAAGTWPALQACCTQRRWGKSSRVRVARSLPGAQTS